MISALVGQGQEACEQPDPAEYTYSIVIRLYARFLIQKLGIGCS